MSTVKPLLHLVQAEKRIKRPEPKTLEEKIKAVERDFNTEPWMRGEAATFWTVERIAALKAENEKVRKERK